jgi:hypothetical protein
MTVKFDRKYCDDFLKNLLSNVSNNRIHETITILVVSFINCYPFVVWGGGQGIVFYTTSQKDKKNISFALRINPHL